MRQRSVYKRKKVEPEEAEEIFQTWRAQREPGKGDRGGIAKISRDFGRSMSTISGILKRQREKHEATRAPAEQSAETVETAVAKTIELFRRSFPQVEIVLLNLRDGTAKLSIRQEVEIKT